MARDSRTSGARLERLRGTQPLQGWVEHWSTAPDPGGQDVDVGGRCDEVGGAPDDTVGRGEQVGRGRHAATAGAGTTVSPVLAPGGRWRWTGVPVGAAVALLVAAVVLVLLLGRGDDGDELVVGPVDTTPTVLAAPDGPVAPTPSGSSGQPAAGAADATTGTTGAGRAAPDAPVTGATLPAGPLVVHVDGAVTAPGVVTVPAGSRVSDAVAAAGGVTAEADTRLVNLARPLQDGELVVVPRPGEVFAAQAAPGGAPGAAAPGVPGQVGAGPGGAGPGGAGGVGSTRGLVDLNSADATGLDGLPGIGPVLAQRIVEHREQGGVFVSVDDLTAVSGIGPAVLAEIRDLVTV